MEDREARVKKTKIYTQMFLKYFSLDAFYQ